MRSRLSVAVGLLLALLVAACGNSANSILQNGIGTSLHRPDTFDRALAAEKFFGVMCQRAGVRISIGADGVPVCDFASMGHYEWRRVVYAGLDDIDERCDQYVESLNAARRDRDVFRKQLHETATTTVAIFGLTTGVSAIGIAVLQSAFGLAESSLDNYYSRLLLTLDTTTVHSIVRKQALAYRQSLAASYINNVANKPTAYYAIRGYLRLCLPATIEGEVNSALVDVHYRETGERRIAVGINPDLAALAAVPETPRTATEKIQRGSKAGGQDDKGNTTRVGPDGKTTSGGQGIGGAAGEETKFGREIGMKVQAALCLKPTGDFGPVASGSPTRLAIAQYHAATNRHKGAPRALASVEIGLISDHGACDLKRHANAFEKFLYPTEDSIRRLQNEIRAAFIAAKPSKPNLAGLVEAGNFASGALDDRTRRAFRAIHTEGIELSKRSPEAFSKLSIDIKSVHADRMTPELHDVWSIVRDEL